MCLLSVDPIFYCQRRLVDRGQTCRASSVYVSTRGQLLWIRRLTPLLLWLYPTLPRLLGERVHFFNRLHLFIVRPFLKSERSPLESIFEVQQSFLIYLVQYGRLIIFPYDEVIFGR